MKFVVKKIINKAILTNKIPCDSKKVQTIINEEYLQGPSSFNILPDSSIIVADECDNKLKIFSLDGSFVKVKNLDKNAFHYPIDVISRNDILYITDKYNHRIIAIDMSGKILWIAGGYGKAKGKLKEPYGITFIDEETLAISDSGNARIVFYSINGTFVDFFGRKGIGKEYYESISFKTKVIYKLWNNSVSRFQTIDTNFIDSGFDIGTLESPKGITCNNDKIYVCDYSGRLQVFSVKGELLKTYYQNREYGENLFSYIQWIEVINNNIYFTRELGNSIYVIEKDGSINTFFQYKGHYIEKFHFHDEYIYFMSPWERKLFRINIKEENSATKDTKNN